MSEQKQKQKQIPVPQWLVGTFWEHSARCNKCKLDFKHSELKRGNGKIQRPYFCPDCGKKVSLKPTNTKMFKKKLIYI